MRTTARTKATILYQKQIHKAPEERYNNKNKVNRKTKAPEERHNNKTKSTEKSKAPEERHIYAERKYSEEIEPYKKRKPLISISGCSPFI